MDVYAVNTRERAFSVLMLLFGLLITAFTVSSITSSLTLMFQDSRNLNLLSMRRFLHDKKVPSGLSAKIRENVEVAIRRRETQEVQDIALLEKVSEPLLEELHWHIYWATLEKHPFFGSYQDSLGVGRSKGPAQRICRTAIFALKVPQGSILFNAGEAPETPKMYFLTSGQMFYIIEQLEEELVEPGAWIGEPSLWAKWVHLGTLRARTDCTLFVVDGEKFQKVVKNNSQSDLVINYANRYVKSLSSTALFALTDLGGMPDSEEIATNVFHYQAARAAHLRGAG